MKTPDPLAPLILALHDLVTWFRALKVKGVVIGGVAASLLGRPRLTHDVDALILMEREKWEGFIDSGKKFGFMPRIPKVINFAQLHRVFLMRHEPSALDIDISIGALPFEEEAIKRRKLVKLARVKIPLPTPEDLIIMKAVAHRPRDMADIESILETHSSVDEKYILKRVKEFSAALEMPEILKDLKTILKRKPLQPSP